MKRKMLATLLALAALLPGCAGRTASADVLPTPKAEMSA